MSLISGRVILAAARLALVYTVLVTLELVAVSFAWRVGAPRLGDIAAIAAGLAIPFAAAFILLAVARRWGFVALWAVLGGLWIFMTIDAGIATRGWEWSFAYGESFLPWSIFALPLWIIGQVGIPSRASARLRIGPLHFSASTALLVCWAALLLGAQWLIPPEIFVGPYRPLGIANLAGWIWGVAPLLLCAYAMRHVWRGTATLSTATTGQTSAA